MCLKIILFPLGCTGSLLQRGLFSGVGEQGLLSSCGAQASRGSSLSCCEARARGCAGFSSCSSRALRHRLNSCGPRLGCSAACGTFPDQGSNPCLLHWQADSLPLSHLGSPCVKHGSRQVPSAAWDKGSTALKPSVKMKLVSLL